jgi:UDP-N-acetylglucosamine 2-epimerase
MDTFNSSNINLHNIVNSAEIVLNKFKKKEINERNDKIYPDYAEQNVSDKIINIIQSYTHYINKKIWFKF